eukprot:1923592-Rhodomonas_salina.3
MKPPGHPSRLPRITHCGSEPTQCIPHISEQHTISALGQGMTIHTPIAECERESLTRRLVAAPPSRQISAFVLTRWPSFSAADKPATYASHTIRKSLS